MKSYEDLKEKTLAITGFFETSSGYPTCYGVYSGNHDDAGGSFGVLQFNWKTGSIQPILKYMFESHNADTRTALGTVYDDVYNTTYNLSIADQIAWGESITDYSRDVEGRKVLIDYETGFMNLGTLQACIDYQKPFSENWLPNAHKWFDTLGLYSRRGFALVWDISVQQGRLFSLNQIISDFRKIDPTGKTRAQIEEEKLRIICTRTAWDNRPSEFSQIVYDRKIMLINGTGDYYGATFDMSQYDLNYDPAFEGGIFSG